MPQRIDIQDLLIWSFQTQRVETRLHTDPEARTVYWAVLALPGPHAAVVSRFAREASQPDWRTELGGPIVSLDRVRLARTQYTEWVRALTVLQQTLEGALTRFRVTGPHLDDQPWLRERLRA
ncbi:MAG: hypothetical protein ACO1OG_07115 [Devosia sp.]